MPTEPAMQIITNVIVDRGDGHVALTKYGPDDDPEDKWWLPGRELKPYEHPDDIARAVLKELGSEPASIVRLVNVQSFRGRRGWHLAFDYLTSSDVTLTGPASWHRVDDLPRTQHGNWESGTIDRARQHAR